MINLTRAVIQTSLIIETSKQEIRNMSHTTTIGQVLFADPAALRAAAAELKDHGVDCELLENVAPRAYYSNQLPVAPVVLKLNKSRYDVGFYPTEQDGGKLEAKADFFAGDIAKQIGVPNEEGVTSGQAAIGKLSNAYATHAAMNQASRQGATVTRQTNDDGSVRLVIRNAA